MPEATALSFAVLVHAALYLPITLWGAIEWWRQHLSLGRLREADAEEEVDAPPPSPRSIPLLRARGGITRR